MDFNPGTPVHVFNRTNLGRVAYPGERNYFFFLDKLRRHVLPHARILAYCLMPSHFHLLLLPGCQAQALNRQIGIMLRSYTRALQRQEDFVGSLFQQGSKSREIDAGDDRCIHYIHLNPVMAGLVDRVDAWPYSSIHEYSRSIQGICDTGRGRELFDVPDDPRELAIMYASLIGNTR
jgi:putative transposase